MSKKMAFLFPGQGAQYPGMGKDFYDQFPIARHVFEEADEYLQRSFSKLIFEGPSDELVLTCNSQIAIYITSIAILRVIQQEFPLLAPEMCAGLSLGEYTALAAAEKIQWIDGLDLVRTRAEAMHQACLETKGSMQVVLGLTENQVETTLRDLSPPQLVWIANLNCPGQVVIAGSLESLAVAAESLKKNGARRILPLDVSGAFHSGLMSSAKETLAKKIAAAAICESGIQLVMNVPGDFVSSTDQIRSFLVDQLTSIVRWEKGISAMMQRKPDLYIEIGPGKTLKGMNQRIGVEEPTLSIEKVEDLQQLHAEKKEVLCNC
jgi:[acyl-carrier-protein] S-malonyltransferase